MPRAGLNADRVVAGGAELADEIGFGQVTLSQVARRFDVKVASLYSHVASSHDLRTRIAQLALTEMADRGAENLAGRSGQDALVALGDTYRDYALEHPGRYAATRYPLDTGTAAESAGRRHSEMMRAVLRGYALDENDQTHAIRLLGSVFHGFVTLELAGAFAHSDPSSQESWSRSLDALDGILRGWPVTYSPSRRTSCPTV
jgi:AcrR family transcriptional regulator